MFLITLFDGFYLTLSSVSLAASMASALSAGVEGKVSSIYIYIYIYIYIFFFFFFFFSGVMAF